MKAIVMFAVVMIASMAGAVSVHPPQNLRPPEELLSATEVNLRDLLGSGDHLSIPRTWKLIGISPGEKANSSNLWFQDADGSVYLLRGSTSQNRLLIHDRGSRIPAR